jgi:hypothetical protein
VLVVVQDRRKCKESVFVRNNGTSRLVAGIDKKRVITTKKEEYYV